MRDIKFCLFRTIKGEVYSMGMQISFFMASQDEVDFYNLINELGDILVDNRGNTLSVEKSMEYKLNQYITAADYANRLHPNKIVDPIDANVIDFTIASCKEKQLEPARLWIEVKFWDDSGDLISKDKWLIDKFNYYKKWIQKNYKLSKDKKYYIGKAAEKLYREEGYKLMSTPKYEVQLD